jgi:SAM-dependent methyltransferase
LNSERSSQLPALTEEWGETEAALLDAFAVPSYLALFTSHAEGLLLVGEAARVVHLGCRTGYPDAEWLQKMPDTTGVGVDASPALLAVASSHLGAMKMRYLAAQPDKTGLDGQSFSHALGFHPLGGVKERLRLFQEMSRLLYPGGQALLALPIGESFQELVDLMAEFALKQSRPDLEAAIDAIELHRPSARQLQEELVSVGLGDVGIETKSLKLTFSSGLAFIEDPAVRLLILPQVAGWLGGIRLEPELFEYWVRAIDRYWSDAEFELSLEVAAVSARR